MTHGRRGATLIVVALILSSMLIAFSGNTAAQGDRPTLRFGVNAADLASLDPHFASATNDRNVVDMVFNHSAETDELGPTLSLRGIEVVNATRETALTCFTRCTLEDALGPPDGGTVEIRADVGASGVPEALARDAGSGSRADRAAA